MEKYYENEAVVLFNEFLKGKKKDLAIIRKYKYNSKYRSKRRQPTNRKRRSHSFSYNGEATDIENRMEIDALDNRSR
jgi:hypothetical protein